METENRKKERKRERVSEIEPRRWKTDRVIIRKTECAFECLMQPHGEIEK